ncbi:hypothetical protein HX776_23550 [Pseudomonas agarici]|uniref:hypothetical protein n=1 Tax=Pseudomonas agarici TaxID=46677 RepID=UPI0003769A25|nr:hypothetical protein [Pseudomonas agarici]NWC11766.1 hypothetical protein [Pseudomonas agarici]SEL91992.1 hypothetical protein SAMN05216604_1605 [Pseudomonas agarici]
MSEVNRYARIGNMVEPTQELLRLYPAMNVYVLASDYDRVAAERKALQQLLNLADERINAATDIVLRARAVIEGQGYAELERDIAAFLKPSEIE